MRYPEEAGHDNEIRLTTAERWILANQFRLLRLLSPEGDELYRQSIEIMENGYTGHYGFAAQYLRPVEFPQRVADEVLDILQMFQEIQWIAEKLDPDDRIRKHPFFEFDGFDGNNDYLHAIYAGFLFRAGEFRELGSQLLRNSHSSITLSIYHDMVAAWKALPRKGLRMTREDIQLILAASRVPFDEEGENDLEADADDHGEALAQPQAD